MDFGILIDNVWLILAVLSKNTKNKINGELSEFGSTADITSLFYIYILDISDSAIL